MSENHQIGVLKLRWGLLNLYKHLAPNQKTSSETEVYETNYKLSKITASDGIYLSLVLKLQRPEFERADYYRGLQQNRQAIV